MAKLGEAYVSINADWSKLEGQVDRGLKSLTSKFENSLNKDFGKRIGNDVGSGLREGVESSTRRLGEAVDRGASNSRRSGRNVGRRIGQGVGDGLSELGPVRRGLANLVSALEDGFSALPAEVKAVVGAALVAAIIPLGALISGAFEAAVIAGVTGLGVALAFQFQEIVNRGQKFLRTLRLRFVEDAEVFVGPLLAAFDLVDKRLALLDPTIEHLFKNASRYVVPFADALTMLVDGIFRGLDRGLAAVDIQGFSDTLVQGFTDLGEALGGVFEDILSNPDTLNALQDLLTLLTGLTVATGAFFNWTVTAWTYFNEVLVDIGNLFDGLVGTIKLFWSTLSFGFTDWGKDFDDFKQRWADFFFEFTNDGQKHQQLLSRNITRRGQFNEEVQGTIKLTDDEAKALKALNKQFEEQEKLLNDLIGTHLSYEESIDTTNDTLKKTKGTLDFDTEAGRKNIENIQKRINNLKEYVKTQVETGQLTESQAQEFYDREIKRLRDEFKARGGNIKQFEDIFKAILALNQSPVVPDKFGNFKTSLAETLALVIKVLAAAGKLNNIKPPKPNTHPGSGGFQQFAEGGMITRPTLALMGEGGQRELVLPMSDPSRSAALLAQSPLAGMMGGSPAVNVYIGNEQLNSRMFRVAAGVNNASARNITQRPRSI